MILICYDGSADAQAAIGQIGALMSGQRATVLTVWEGMADLLTRTGSGFAIAPLDFQRLDADSERTASERAQEGAERARAAGLEADPRVRQRGATISATVLEEAEAVDAGAIVLGSRGLTGVKSLLLGSVSHAVLQHADRPVIIVPSPDVAAERARHRDAG